MKQIRQQVFETNSSSTHSISIADPKEGILMDTLPLDENGNVNLEGGEFGWKQETYNDALTKANYALVYASDWSEERQLEFLDILRTVIKEQTGANEVNFVSHLDWDGKTQTFGYIDHQSVEDGALHYLFEDPEQLRQFIFNPYSELETDNDNH